VCVCVCTWHVHVNRHLQLCQHVHDFVYIHLRVCDEYIQHVRSSSMCIGTYQPYALTHVSAVCTLVLVSCMCTCMSTCQHAEDMPSLNHIATHCNTLQNQMQRKYMCNCNKNVSGNARPTHPHPTTSFHTQTQTHTHTHARAHIRTCRCSLSFLNPFTNSDTPKNPQQKFFSFF